MLHPCVPRGVPVRAFRSVTHAVVVLAAAALALPAAARAQPADGNAGGSARISGLVLSEDSEVPVPGVRVQVEGRPLRVETDRRGRFALSGVSTATAGEVTLRLQRVGFAERTVTVAVREGSTARVEIRLAPAALELSPLTVLLERTRMLGDPLSASTAPGSAFHLTAADLRAAGSAFGNVHDVLRQVPGVNVQDEEGFGLRPHIGLRGAGAERSSNVTLMEDGVLIAPAPYAAPAAYHFPVMGRMEGVEVRKGASQVRYGPRTLGGAVNLISASIPSEASRSLDVSAGGHDMLRAHLRAGDAGERAGWLLEGFHMRTDGFKEIQGGGSTGFHTWDVLGRFRVNTERTGPRYQELELKVGLTDHTSDETYLGLTEADFRRTPLLRYAASRNDVLDTDHRQAQLRYLLRPTARTDLVVTAYRNTFARNWYKLQSVNGRGIAAVLADPEAFSHELRVLRGADSEDDALTLRANHRSYDSRGVQAVAGFRSGGTGVRHDVEVGVRYHRDHEDRLQWEDGYRMAAGRMIPSSQGAPGSQANRLSEAEAWAVFLHNEIRAGRWSLVPGVRWETVRFTRTDWEGDDPWRTGEARVRENPVSALIPGVGVAWEWTPRVHLFAGVHRGFGPPGPGADAETRVEESRNWEAGGRVRGAAVGADVTLFHSGYSNILGRATLATSESGAGDLFNGGEAEVYGVEAAADLELDRFLGLPMRVPVRVAYTFNHGIFRSSFESEYGPWGTVRAGDRIPYLPEHAWSGSVGVDDGGRLLSLSWHGAAAMRTEAGRGPIAEGTGADRFTVLNLRGEWDMGERGVVYGGVQNLADARHVVSRRPAGARPGLPRTLFLGFRIAR